MELVEDDENTDVDGRDNTGLDYDDTEGNADRRNNYPDRNNNRSSISGKRKPYNREYDEDSDELYPSRGRNRKHWKKNKDWKNHPACIKHGKYHPRCRNIRKNGGGHHHDHDYHHRHHHHHHRRPKHRRPSHDDEDIDDEYYDYNRNNKGRGKYQGNKNRTLPPRQPDEREQNPKLDGDDDASLVPVNRNNNDELQ